MSGSSLRDLGEDLYAEGQYEQALKAFAETVRRIPADHRSRMFAARCLIRMGERERAVLVLHACAEGLLGRDFLLSAMAACKLALDQSPKEKMVLDTLARIHARAVKTQSGKAQMPPLPPAPLSEGGVDQELLGLHGEALLDAALEVLSLPDDGGKADPDARPPLPLFADLEREAFVKLVSQLVYRDVEPDALVAHEGEGGDTLYVIVAGAAEVSRRIDGEDRPLGLLRGGSIFGELSLLTGTPSTATVTAVAPSEVFEIRREHLNDVARTHPSISRAFTEFAQGRMTRNLIATAPLFQPIPEADRPALLQRFRFRALAAGEKVLVEGEHSAGLVLVLSGELMVQKEDPAGGSVSLGVLREGEVVGEISLLTGLRATATVIATRKTAAAVLERSSFAELLRDFPHARQYLEGLSDRRLAQIKEALRPAEIIDADELVLESDGATR
jgi:CRP-like cAMP-binding protein